MSSVRDRLVLFVSNDKWYLILIAFTLFACLYTVLHVDDKVNEVHEQYQEFFDNNECYPKLAQKQNLGDVIEDINIYSDS